MKILYFLEHPMREIEVFIRREVMEAMRQGVLVEAAHPAEGEYRIERAEAILSPDPAPDAAAPSGSSVRPSPATLAMARGAAMSPSGALRAARHAREGGAGLGSRSEERRVGKECRL